MAALRKRALFGLCCLALSGAAFAASTPSSPDAIASAAFDCWEAATGPTLNETQLKSRGWLPGSAYSADGKPLTKAPRFYGKAKSAVMLIVMDTPGTNGCAVASAVSKEEDITATAKLFTARLRAIDPNLKAGRKGQAVVLISGSKVAEFAATGTPGRPGTRIVIANTSAEKK